jgi:hypothetical protein
MSQNDERVEELMKTLDKLLTVHHDMMVEQDNENHRVSYDILHKNYIPTREKFMQQLKELFTK